MTINPCTQCGARAFALSKGLRDVECDECGKPLFSWQAFRRESLGSASGEDDLADDEGAFRAYIYTPMGSLSQAV